MSTRTALPHLNKLDVDVLTFECARATLDLGIIGKTIHRQESRSASSMNLQVERPEQVADLIRRGPQVHPGRSAGAVERLWIRPGGHEPADRLLQDGVDRPRRRHRVALGLPEARCLAADSRYALAEEV